MKVEDMFTNSDPTKCPVTDMSVEMYASAYDEVDTSFFVRINDGFIEVNYDSDFFSYKGGTVYLYIQPTTCYGESAAKKKISIYPKRRTNCKSLE